MTIPRIYFDENNCDPLGRYDLGIPGSLKDIAPIASEIKQGMRVIIYTPGELELEAILEFDSTHGRWKARPIEGTTKYLDGPNDPSMCTS